MEKTEQSFRDYSVDTSVRNFYHENHTKQTLDFVLKIKESIPLCQKTKMSILDAVSLLDEIVDDSDPDLNLPQIFHALQVGEAAKKKHPELDWFHLVGFIHDLGKVMAHRKLHGLPQWAVVGDTF